MPPSQELKDAETAYGNLKAIVPVIPIPKIIQQLEIEIDLAKNLISLTENTPDLSLLTQKVVATIQQLISVALAIAQQPSRLNTDAIKQLLTSGYPLMQEDLAQLILAKLKLVHALSEQEGTVALALAKEILSSINVDDLLDATDTTRNGLQLFLLTRERLQIKPDGLSVLQTAAVAYEKIRAQKNLEAVQAKHLLSTSPSPDENEQYKSTLQKLRLEVVAGEINLCAAKLDFLTQQDTTATEHKVRTIVAAVHYIHALRKKAKLLPKESPELPQLKEEIALIIEQYKFLTTWYEESITALLTLLNQATLTASQLAQALQQSIMIDHLLTCITCLKTHKQAITDNRVIELTSALEKNITLCKTITPANMEQLDCCIRGLGGLPPSYALVTIHAALNFVREKSTPFWENRWFRLAAALIVVAAAFMLTGGIALGIVGIGTIGLKLKGAALLAAQIGAMVLTPTIGTVAAIKISPDAPPVLAQAAIPMPDATGAIRNLSSTATIYEKLSLQQQLNIHEKSQPKTLASSQDSIIDQETCQTSTPESPTL